MFDVDKLNIYWRGTSTLFNIKENSDFNELLDIEKEILLHPRNAHMLFMPVIDDLLKQDARKEIIGRLKKLPLKDPTTFFQALTPQKNVEKGLTFVKSKFGVGIVALDITGHAVFMIDNVNLNPYYNNPSNEYAATSTKLLFEGMGNNYSLTSMYDSSGRIISEVQSQTMNSQVDAGKDPYAVGLGINNQTLSMIMYLNRRGVPIITILKFINQPSIQQYLEAQRINESFINKQRGEELKKDELIDVVYTTNEQVRPQLNRNTVIRERDLDNGILNGVFDQNQAQYLEYFLALVDEVGAFNDVKNSLTVDTKGKKDKADIENFEKLQETVDNTNLISQESLHRLRYEGILSPFYHAQQMYRMFYGRFYAVDNSNVGERLKEFRDMMESRQKTQYLKGRVRTTIENDFIVFLISNFHSDFSLQKFNQLFGFEGDRSLAKEIQDLQKNPRLNDNLVIRALYPLLSISKDAQQEKLFDVIRLFERELSTIDVNDYTDAMKDIKNEVSEELYKSIVQLSIYQAGFLNSPFSLNKILPTFDTTERKGDKLTAFTNDYLRSIQLEVINKLNEQGLNDGMFESFVSLFYQNNPQFLPKRFWAKSPIPYFYLWSKDRQERVLRYIKGGVSEEVKPLGNTYFKRYFLDNVKTVDLTPTEKEGEKTSNKGIVTIISGGQTGVDELGLEVAKSLGIKTGGTAPKGFKQETSNKPELAKLYGMSEITAEQQAEYTIRTGKNDPYTARTEMNVRNSDGTVYFSHGESSDSGGKAATMRSAKEWKKPFLDNPTVDELRKWIFDNNIQVLNVAGNRGSKLTSNQLENFRNILTEALKNPIIPTSQQLDLFSGLTEPLPSMEDQMYTPEEMKEAKEKKEQCKGTPKIIK